jgi:hypothetical protein
VYGPIFIVVQNEEGRLPSASNSMGSDADLLEKTWSELLAKMGRRGGEFAKRLFRVHLFCTLSENFFGLYVIWVRYAAIDRTDGRALFLVEVSNAFRAFLGDDVIEIIRDCVVHSVQFPLHTAGIDGRVGAFRLTGSTVDAFFSDHC